MSGTTDALILAAGRGSRLLSLTDDRPKGLVTLRGRPLVEWQVAALRRAGLERITLVTGYLSKQFDALGLPTVHNLDWHRTNMVGSLMCRLDGFSGPLLLSYSDVVHQPAVIEALLAADADIAVSYDIDWLELWSRRFEDPLSDAESFRIDAAGELVEIGRRVSDTAEIEGQFMGLVSLSARGVEIIREIVGSRPEYRAGLDMTGLLDICLQSGHVVRGVPTRGAWCEVDTQDDLAVAEALIREGRLTLTEPTGDRS